MTELNSLGKIGIVVPTLGERPLLIVESLLSARNAGANHIQVVTKSADFGSQLVSSGLADDYVLECKAGLAAAINFGLQRLPRDIVYINWLADDDLLEPNSLNLLREVLERGSKDVLCVHGKCAYISVSSQKLFVMPTGSWANFLMRVGPQLLAQPACLIRREAFQQVGGLDESLHWAFDLALLLKLNALKRSAFVNHSIAKFRWHSGSLSVDGRRQSVREAQTVRRRHAKGIAHLLLLFNPIISQVILLGGKVVSRYAGHRQY